MTKPDPRTIRSIGARLSSPEPKITNIKINVRTVSKTNDCTQLPLSGNVAPKFATLPKLIRNNIEAAIAPTDCAKIYGSTRRLGKNPLVQNAKVTAGLKCAPLKCQLSKSMQPQLHRKQS